MNCDTRKEKFMKFNKDFIEKLMNGELDPNLIRFKVMVEAYDLDKNKCPIVVDNKNGHFKTKKIDDAVVSFELKYVVDE